MVTHAENDLMTRVEGDAPLGRLMRENYWVPFALSENLVAGDAPTPVRLFGENYVAFRAPDGRIGFLDELCPHRRASLVLARAEGDGLRCIYHGWKIDVSGCVVEAPTQVGRHEQFCAAVRVVHFPGARARRDRLGVARRRERRRFQTCPSTTNTASRRCTRSPSCPRTGCKGSKAGSTRCTRRSCTDP